MNYNRFLLLALMAFFFSSSQAQITAYIKGKEVKQNATITTADLPTLEVSFKNPKLPSFIYGRSSFIVYLFNSKNEYISYWVVSKTGVAPVEDFLKNTPASKKFKVFNGDIFVSEGNTLDWVINSAYGKEANKTVKVSVQLLYREETGYQQYGSPISLLEPLVLNLPLFDNKNMFLPYLDLKIDKTNISSDFDLKQSGRLDDKDTEFGYAVKDNKKIFYTVYALSSDDHAGLNTAEVASDFIHEAVDVSSQGATYKDYDVKKYNFPWDDISGLDNSSTNLFRLAKLGLRNKDIKGMDLMTLFQSAEVSGLKGYMLTDDVQIRSHINARDWRTVGKFFIYILNHPTNPKLTLIVSSKMYGNEITNAEELDAFLKTIINSIKR
jgi:hypothetical protein